MSYRKKALSNSCHICKYTDDNLSVFDVHHISEQAKDIKEYGKSNNAKYNLVTLCPTCHRKAHLGEILIERWVLSAPDGYLLMWKYKEGNWQFT